MMMSLGLFVFTIATASYQQLQHSTAQRWATNNRIGERPAYQYLGIGEESITLSGSLYPEITGGPIYLTMIKDMANSGTAYTLMSGTGETMRAWIIQQISETHTVFFTDGTPRKIEFNLQLKRVEDLHIEQLGELSGYIDTARNTGVIV